MTDMFEVLTKFGSAGLLAGALIYVVKLMLDASRQEASTERQAHSAEIERVLTSHESAMDRVVVGFAAATERIASEIRDLDRSPRA